ncbi:MAG: acetate--CoA ligase family protein, partial [bacterium]
LYKDAALRVSPLDKFEISEMMDETKIIKILDGIRGEKKIDRAEIIDMILKIQWLLGAFPQIKEAVLNPIMIKDGRAYIVDARVAAE